MYLRLERLPSDKRPEGSQRRFHESYRQAGRPKDGMWLVSKWHRCVSTRVFRLSLSLSLSPLRLYRSLLVASLHPLSLHPIPSPSFCLVSLSRQLVNVAIVANGGKKKEREERRNNLGKREARGREIKRLEERRPREREREYTRPREIRVWPDVEFPMSSRSFYPGSRLILLTTNTGRR